MNNQKLISTAKCLDTISRIICWICMIGSTAIVIFNIVMLFMKEDFFLNTTASLNLGYVTLELEGNVSPDAGVIRSRLIFDLFMLMIILLAVAYGLALLRNILKPMKEGRPFEAVVSRNLKRMGILVMVGGVVYNLLGNIGMRMAIDDYNLKSLIGSTQISDIRVENNFSLMFIAFAAILFLLSYIFRYGEQLQQESDETL